MSFVLSYNVTKYINSCIGETTMTLDVILNGYKSCKRYELNKDVSAYIKYIDTPPFYVAPSFNDVKTDHRSSSLNPKLILFSAPGATGKTSLAKHIAHRYGALYWNVAKVQIGTNSFAGSILNAIGAPNYSNFISNLNSASTLLVIDAFDEAEIVSGRKMIGNFISEINTSLTAHTMAPVFLLARTETAQFIASFCAENSISFKHYEIGFFYENEAKDFITKTIERDNRTITAADNDCINAYYDVIRNNITPEECDSFLGYAPVLEAIAKNITANNNRQKIINELQNRKDCVSIIMQIMDRLLIREQEDKVVEAFRVRCQSNYPDFKDWGIVYSPEEQLVRIVNYILFNEVPSYDTYTIKGLPSHLIDDYQEIIKQFLPQHPFIRNIISSSRKYAFTGPAFRDYTLAKILLSKDYELADLYFEESQSQSYFPSQIFFDCYRSISDNNIKSEHLSYVYDSFKAKATAKERPYLQVSEISGEIDGSVEYLASFGIRPNKTEITKEEILLTVTVSPAGLWFDQVSSISINTPTIPVTIGKRSATTRFSDSSIVCKKIIWNSQNIAIECFDDNSCLIVSHDDMESLHPVFEILGNGKPLISAPNINDFHRLINYKYDFENSSDIDAIKFIHGLRCILMEFRTHRKDMLAKTADRIEYVVVGNSSLKRKVLNYMKETKMLYEASHLYKIITNGR